MSGRLRSLLDVNLQYSRKIVDATSKPNFTVAEDVKFVAINDICSDDGLCCIVLSWVVFRPVLGLRERFSLTPGPWSMSPMPGSST